MQKEDVIFRPDGDTIAKASHALQTGKLVAFPTETVYGLGANALDDKAVSGIFAAKGRPAFNPLIVHVPNLEAAQEYAHFNEAALKLARAFWPGALTLVVKRKADCPLSLLVSAGLDTVALRVPNHRLAQELLETSGLPLAAPSANRSGSISPTRAEHVQNSLGDNVDMILDGGACKVGLESTVIDATEDSCGFLRPGGIAKETIEKICGPLRVAGTDQNAPKSPGMLLSHYAPSLPVRLNATGANEGEAFLAFGKGYDKADLNLSLYGDTEEAAANLFAMMHALDRPEFSGLAIAPIPNEGLGLAINDRLTRASAGRNEEG